MAALRTGLSERLLRPSDDNVSPDVFCSTGAGQTVLVDGYNSYVNHCAFNHFVNNSKGELPFRMLQNRNQNREWQRKWLSANLRLWPKELQTVEKDLNTRTYSESDSPRPIKRARLRRIAGIVDRNHSARTAT